MAKSRKRTMRRHKKRGGAHYMLEYPDLTGKTAAQATQMGKDEGTDMSRMAFASSEDTARLPFPKTDLERAYQSGFESTYIPTIAVDLGYSSAPGPAYEAPARSRGWSDALVAYDYGLAPTPAPAAGPSIKSDPAAKLGTTPGSQDKIGRKAPASSAPAAGPSIKSDPAAKLGTTPKAQDKPGRKAPPAAGSKRRTRKLRRRGGK